MSSHLIMSSRAILQPLKSQGFLQQIRTVVHHSRIGQREVVGWGVNGQSNYFDIIMAPFPAIRWKEDTPEIKALKEKEKQDWKKLSIEDKRQLYRASFCQTFAEMNAPTGEWKSILGCTLGFISLALWLFLACKVFVYPPMPETLSLERRQALLKHMLDARVDPVEGVSSKWDYEKNQWK